MENNARVSGRRELSRNDHFLFQRFAVAIAIVSFFYTLASNARDGD